MIPYLLASLLAQLWWLGQGQGRDLSSLVQELLLGASFGPYYYVFVHFWLVLFAALFAVLPPRALWGLTAAMLLAQAVVESGTGLPFFWHLRVPPTWWAYFLVGFMLRLHYEPVRRLVTKHRGVLCAGATATAADCVVPAITQAGTGFAGAAEWLYNYAIIALLRRDLRPRGAPLERTSAGGREFRHLLVASLLRLRRRGAVPTRKK